MIKHYLLLRKIGHRRVESIKRACINFLIEKFPAGSYPHFSEYEIESDLQRLEKMVKEDWKPEPYIGDERGGIPGLQAGLESIHYEYSYDESRFSKGQVRRYFAVLEKTREDYKTFLDVIADMAKKNKENDKKEEELGDIGHKTGDYSKLEEFLNEEDSRKEKESQEYERLRKSCFESYLKSKQGK